MVKDPGGGGLGIEDPVKVAQVVGKQEETFNGI
jgi:hypothetical protein